MHRSHQAIIEEAGFMNFLHRDITSASQWQNYKRLELIDDSIPAPQAYRFGGFGLNQIWRQWIIELVRALGYRNQQVNYLERCWLQDGLQPAGIAGVHTWQRLWALMK